MTLKTVFQLKLKYYNFGEVFSQISFDYDHYPSEEEMMEKVREYEKTRKTLYTLKLSVEKIYEVKR